MKKNFKKLEFVVCPKCGYNNEKKRFGFFGSCLRCGLIIDKKIYLKKLLYLNKRRNYEREEQERKRFTIY